MSWVRQQGATPLVFGERAAAHGRFGPRAMMRLVRHLRAQPVDVVYVVGLRASVWVRSLKPWLRGARIVHGVRWNPGSNSRLDVAFRLVERWLGRWIDVYITNSNAAAVTMTTFCGVPREKIRVVHNGLGSLPDDLPPYTARPCVVLTVANLSPRKGYLQYLDVVQQVTATEKSAKFVFVGRDDMDGAVQGAIRRRGLTERVSYVGCQEHISSWMRQARVFVLPSLWNEGCPTAILEAKAHAVPVVAYALDGIPEIVRDGSEGILVNVGDRSALTRAIVGLLRDVPAAERMGAEGSIDVGKSFTLAACARGHREAFSHLVRAGLGSGA